MQHGRRRAGCGAGGTRVCGRQKVNAVTSHYKVSAVASRYGPARPCSGAGSRSPAPASLQHEPRRHGQERRRPNRAARAWLGRFLHNLHPGPSPRPFAAAFSPPRGSRRGFCWVWSRMGAAEQIVGQCAAPFLFYLLFFCNAGSALQNAGQHLVHVLVPLGVTAAFGRSRTRLLLPQHRGRMVPEPLAHGLPSAARRKEPKYLSWRHKRSHEQGARKGRAGGEGSQRAGVLLLLPPHTPFFPSPSSPLPPLGEQPVLAASPGPKAGETSHKPLAPMGRGRSGKETPTQEAASLAATSWGVSRALGGHRGVVLGPPGCLGRWWRRGCPWGSLWGWH